MAFQSVFGAGYLWGTVPGGTPRLFAALQNVSVDFSRDMKPMHGQSAYALEHGPGKAKIECKADIGRFDPNVFNDIYFGGSVTTGFTSASNLEQWAIPTTPYQVTVANSATWATDLGVYNRTTGKFMTKVPSGTPTTGQYKVAAGVYTFAAADTGQLVSISYTYTTAGSGYSLAVGNPQIGTVQIFRADLFSTFRGITSGITLPACQSSKLGLPFKQDDFLLPAFDFVAQDDGTGNAAYVYGTGTY